MGGYSYVNVVLKNGNKYKVKCVNLKRIGSIILCELAQPNQLDFGILFWKNKMFLYDVPDNGVCGNGYSSLDLLFLSRVCVKEIEELKGVVSDHFLEPLS